MLSRFSCVRLFATLWTVAHQVPLLMGFSKEEYWSELPCPSPGDLPDPGTEPASSAAPALQVDSLPLAPPGNRTRAHATGTVGLKHKTFSYRDEKNQKNF